MTLPLEEDSRPPYVQAAEVLRAAIRNGELRPGEKLPSARELQRRFGIASSTVQNALRLLKDEGLIYSVLGRGSYVRVTEESSEAGADASDPAYVGLGGLLTGWKPAPDDPRPPYVQTADALRKEIQDGRFPPGSKLPSARELQDRFGIANSTAQNALRQLKDEGLIYSVQGRGVFVRTPSPREQFMKRYHESLEEMAAQHRADEEAVRLSGKSDEEVAAELESAEERLEKARTEYEAAMADVQAMTAAVQQRKRLRGEPDPNAGQRLRDRLDEARKRR
ncbi:GntR family transcriptional regulator [Kitasatospora sp. RB6PN24]|uniref:GntR family transcriptional regulator n=1 Tax=Kitasatospora humi TaxID=2893891 RepID=UPI001E5602E3|nr:GntR family transcriptional regulator [Kitasatospora humi]MCC9311889.1 GntR family transcriptional regulator [Kitasatospora humi]